MNELYVPTPNEADDNAQALRDELISILVSAAPELLARLLWVLTFLETASGQLKAIVVKLSNPDLTNKQVAAICGVDERTLRKDRSPMYDLFCDLLEAEGTPIRGRKTRDGGLEAWKT